MKVFPLLAGVLLAACAGARAEGLAFSMRAEAFAEPVSIDAFTSGWHDELRSGDDAALHARAELRHDRGPWHLAWRWRYDYQLEFTPGTAELHHRFRNGLPVAPGHAYPLNIEAYHIERHGPGIGYRLEYETFQLELALNAYLGLGLIDGRTRGQAVFAGTRIDADQIRDLQLQIDYYYREPELHEESLDWTPPPPEGMGYGIDMAAHWRLPTGSELRLQLDDLFGEMYWRDAPTTAITARCDCTVPSYDVEGGLRIEARYRQRILPYAELTALHPLAEQWRIGARLLSDTWLSTYQLGIERQQGAHLLGLWHEPDYHAWRLVYQQAHARLSWTADTLDTSEAHRLGVDLTFFAHW